VILTVIGINVPEVAENTLWVLKSHGKPLSMFSIRCINNTTCLLAQNSSVRVNGCKTWNLLGSCRVGPLNTFPVMNGSAHFRLGLAAKKLFFRDFEKRFQMSEGYSSYVLAMPQIVFFCNSGKSFVDQWLKEIILDSSDTGCCNVLSSYCC